MAAPSSAVEIRGVVKRYGKVQAVSGVSFDVARGSHWRRQRCGSAISSE